ncbi:hypothetical protein JHK85_026397 [Glycine max]|nr:hypothetical protein JHK85_026397 [Glycine max]
MVQRLEEFLEEERMRILGFRRYVLSSWKHRLLDVVARSNSFEKSVVVALSGGGIVILDEVFEMRPLIQMERSASKLQVPIK